MAGILGLFGLFDEVSMQRQCDETSTPRLSQSTSGDVGGKQSAHNVHGDSPLV